MHDTARKYLEDQLKLTLEKVETEKESLDKLTNLVYKLKCSLHAYNKKKKAKKGIIGTIIGMGILIIAIVTNPEVIMASIIAKLVAIAISLPLVFVLRKSIKTYILQKYELNKARCVPENFKKLSDGKMEIESTIDYNMKEITRKECKVSDYQEYYGILNEIYVKFMEEEEPKEQDEHIKKEMSEEIQQTWIEDEISNKKSSEMHTRNTKKLINLSIF